jgi:catechol-2,3-dioxygenase/predicted esterase
MNDSNFHLPAETHIANVHLQVSSLERALHFYRDLLGFKEIHCDNESAILSATGNQPAHILLTARVDAKPKPPHTTGLYHVAIRFPNRRELAKVFRRLLKQEWPFQGFSDHGVSEALYLADPDGNGVELYADRPREQWNWQSRAVTMFTKPLDVENLLSEADENDEHYQIHPQTDIGHVHLHVSDLKKAETFYHDLLGLEVTQRSYPGALFLSAGGYHHHVGLNIWAGQGAPPPPSDAVGLLSFSITIPDQQTIDTLKGRFNGAGILPEEINTLPGEAGSLAFRDADGNLVALLLKRAITFISKFQDRRMTTDKIKGPHQGQPVLHAGAPLEGAQATMILIHGRGATAESILTLAGEFEQNAFAYLAPQAADGTWYPNRFIAPIESNEPWLSSALVAVDEVITQVAKAGIPHERIMLLGFSQGACLALEFAARNAQRYGGVIGLSGGLIGPDGTPRDYPGSFAGTPIFLGCSDVDFHIPEERVHETASVLQQLGGEVTMRLYPKMDHTVNQDEIEFVRGMMERVLMEN